VKNAFQRKPCSSVFRCGFRFFHQIQLPESGACALPKVLPRLAFLAVLGVFAGKLHGQPMLGEAQRAPANLTASPQAATPRKLDLTVTGGFRVNTAAREEVRDFYNALYPASDNVPENSTADQANCFAGHNAAAFMDAELLRINWFRAMAGMPATVTLDPVDNGNAQQMAVIISQNGLNHHPPTNDICYNSAGASVSGGNQGIGFNGPDCTTGYVQDFGANNSEVGHRRWILYPPETVMGIGDVPQEGALPAANLTWVFDPRSFGPRPPTRQPFVSWPPAGYVPWQLAFPYWSFSYPDADFSAATVTMESNGVSVAVSSYLPDNGFGDNTLVWVPMGLDATSGSTLFPFSGTDTVYGVTVSNVNVAGTNLAFTYNVTLFDPAQPGPDYAPVAISGPSQALVNAGTVYCCSPPNDPHVTSYNFLTARLLPSNIVENAALDLAACQLVNFSISPPPNYPLITNAPDGSTNVCFHLCHAGTNSFPQLLQLTNLLYPSSNTVLSFDGALGYATSSEIARVQISTDGGATWTDLYTQPGGVPSFTFTPYSLPLSNYAGQAASLRFNYDFTGGDYYADNFNYEGWCLENIALTNSQLMLNLATNTPAATSIPSGDLFDDASNGLTNFTILPASIYYAAATNAPDGSGPCFHLCHFDPTSQFLQLNELLLPAANSTVGFDSLLGYATSDETARVQVSTNNGAAWTDLFVEAGPTNGSAQSSFTPESLSLSNYAGQLTLLRFNFAFTGGNYFTGTANYVGWDIENIVITNVRQRVITVLDTTNFTFTPAAVGTYLIQARPVIFTQFPLAFGPGKVVNVVSNLPASIALSQPVVAGGQVVLNFTVSGLSNPTFRLLQADQLGAGWTTNTTAALATNGATSYRFTTAAGPAARFYRIKSP